jgi:hypothetical protein
MDPAELSLEHRVRRHECGKSDLRVLPVERVQERRRGNGSDNAGKCPSREYRKVERRSA